MSADETGQAGETLNLAGKAGEPLPPPWDSGERAWPVLP